MSRLHIFAAAPAEIARQFDVATVPAVDLPSETTEGARGLAVYEYGGRRFLKAMDWGFPRQTREMLERGDLPGRIGLVADLTNPLWKELVVEPRYRCIIPITHFANPEGVQGGKTRTWFSVKGQKVAAWAGFCRNVPGYGPVYAGMTMDAKGILEPTNDRIPVLLDPHQYSKWLYCPIRDVIGFQFAEPIAADRLVVERTDDLWRSGALPSSGQPQLALL